MRVDFLEPESSLVLEKEGDFLFLAKDVFHRYEFLEDSLVISLRYPAVDDQVRK
jgi:quercetin dioxygenase-like cupin family protein